MAHCDRCNRDDYRLRTEGHGRVCHAPERHREALRTIVSQSDEALIAAGKTDPLWAKRVAEEALRN